MRVIKQNPEVSYGLTMFPVSFGCSIANGWPHIPLQQNAETAIESWLNQNGAAGGATPLVSTLEWFTVNADTVWGPYPQSAYLIVMSEGMDTCSCSQYDRNDFFEEQDWADCVEDELSDAIASLLAAGVRTYVIGYKYFDSEELLNAIAANGGTSLSQFLFAGSETSLVDAFDTVNTDLKLCL